jgi:DNA polymerase III subunit delta'
MLFQDVLAQESIKSNLIKSVRENRLHHANLFVGKMGYGTLALGWAFAQYIMCDNPGDDDSCGICSSCVKVSKAAHPDLHFIYPTFESKQLSTELIDSWREITNNPPNGAELKGYFTPEEWMVHNKGKNLKIRNEDCEQVLKNFNLKSFEGKKKVQIIWLAEEIGKESNKLLKIFEEPPEDAIFILLVENIEELLTTIISRCQTFKVPPLHDEIILHHLSEIFPEKSKMISTILRLSDGDIIKAIGLLNDTNLNLEQTTVQWLRLIMFLQTRKNLETVSGLIKLCDTIGGTSRDDQKAFLAYVQVFMKETLSMKYTKSCNLAMDLTKAASYIAGTLEIDQMAVFMSLVDNAVYEIDRNGNGKMIFTNLSIKASRVLDRPSFESKAS